MYAPIGAVVAFSALANVAALDFLTSKVLVGARR